MQLKIQNKRKDSNVSIKSPSISEQEFKVLFDSGRESGAISETDEVIINQKADIEEKKNLAVSAIFAEKAVSHGVKEGLITVEQKKTILNEKDIVQRRILAVQSNLADRAISQYVKIGFISQEEATNIRSMNIHEKNTLAFDAEQAAKIIITSLKDGSLTKQDARFIIAPKNSLEEKIKLSFAVKEVNDIIKDGRESEKKWLSPQDVETILGVEDIKERSKLARNAKSAENTISLALDKKLMKDREASDLRLLPIENRKYQADLLYLTRKFDLLISPK